MASLCTACGSPDCPGLAGVDLCPRWQEAEARHARGEFLTLSGEYITPSADLPACRDEDPATPAVLAAAYPDPPEYQHPEDEEGARLAERDSYIGTWSNIDITKRTPDE